MEEQTVSPTTTNPNPIAAKLSSTIFWMDFSTLNDGDRSRMMQLVEQKQVSSEFISLINKLKDSLRMYVRLVDRCFGDCIHDFTSKTMVSKEVICANVFSYVGSSKESCVSKCADKFMKHSARVGMRFQEENVQMMQKMQEQSSN